MDVTFPGKCLGDFPVGTEDWVGDSPAGKTLGQSECIRVAGELVKTDGWIDLVSGQVAAGGLFEFDGGVHEHVALALGARELSGDEPLKGATDIRVRGIL